MKRRVSEDSSTISLLHLGRDLFWPIQKRLSSIDFLALSSTCSQTVAWTKSMTAPLYAQLYKKQAILELQQHTACWYPENDSVQERLQDETYLTNKYYYLHKKVFYKENTPIPWKHGTLFFNKYTFSLRADVDRRPCMLDLGAYLVILDMAGLIPDCKDVSASYRTFQYGIYVNGIDPSERIVLCDPRNEQQQEYLYSDYYYVIYITRKGIYAYVI